MADNNYEKFKLMVNMCTIPCAVLSVEEKEDGTIGEIIMVATNSLFSMTGEDVEGKAYTEKLPKDSKFETILYNDAFKNEHYSSYVDTTRIYGYWTENMIVPLCREEGSRIGYCQFMYKLTKDMDSGRYSIVSPDIASFVIRTCLNLRKEEDFYSSMELVAKDIREFTDSFAASIMTVSKDLYRFEVVSESVRNNLKNLHDVFANIPYEVVESWEDLVSGTDCIIIRNEEIIPRIINIDFS